MERLTHEADFGFEDWEETLFLVKSDPNGAYNILDIAKYSGEPEFDEILKSIALRLAAYENTGLTPEEVQQMRWIPVEERLPEEKQRVIVRCERVGTSVGWILWGRWMTDIGPHAGDVTHWMHLPKAPKEDNL